MFLFHDKMREPQQTTKKKKFFFNLADGIKMLIQLKIKFGICAANPMYCRKYDP